MTRRSQERVGVSISDRTTLQWIASSSRWSRPFTLTAQIHDLSSTGMSLDVIDTTTELPDSMQLKIATLECFVDLKDTSTTDTGRRLHVQFNRPSERFQTAVDSMIDRLTADGASEAS